MTPPSQSSTSSQMRSIFLTLCFGLLCASFVLYSNTPINWNNLQTHITDKLISVTSPLGQFTVSHNDSVARTRAPRRFAIFACSIHSSVEAYSFYTPITSLSWRRAGYETIVIFAGDFAMPNVLTARLNVSRAYLKTVGAHVIDVQCNASYAVKISQLVRLFAGFLPESLVADDDDILTGDSDLMPLRQSGYLPTNGTDGFIFNAYCCGLFTRRGRSYRMFPMGHIYLKKKTWRAMILESKQRTELLANATDQNQQLLGENAPISFETIALYARHEFKAVFDSAMQKGDSAWYMDQVLCSMMLTDYRENHKDFKVNERGRPARLDRSTGFSFWDRDAFDQFGDAHLFGDAVLLENNWRIFSKLLKSLFNETLVTTLNDYYRQYVIAGTTVTKQRR